MGEVCKDCVYYERLNEKAERNENNIELLRKDMAELKITIATEKERVNNIFSVLKEIKASIDKIGATIDAIKLKPATKWESLTGDIIKTIVAIIIGVIMGKLIK